MFSFFRQFCSGHKEYALFFAIYTLYKWLIITKKKREKLALLLTDIYWYKVSTVTLENLNKVFSDVTTPTFCKQMSAMYSKKKTNKNLRLIYFLLYSVTLITMASFYNLKHRKCRVRKMWRKSCKKLHGFYKKKLCVLNAVQDSTK